ncbi:hypothetical protein AOR10_24195, partial [Vibrio alginolyticus]
LHPVHEDDAIPVLRRGEVNIGHPLGLLGQGRHLEVVGGEQGKGAGAGQVLGAGPGQRQAIEGAGAAADLVHQHQAFIGGVVQDAGGLGHLHHEGGASAGQVVRGADAGKDTVHRADLRLVCRHEAAGVGEQHDQRCLAHVGGLAAHVGAGDHQHAAVVAHHQVVGHEGSVGDSLHHRVATAADGDARGLGQVRAHELQGAGALGEGAQHVQRRQCPSAGLEGVELGVEGVEESLI